MIRKHIRTDPYGWFRLVFLCLQQGYYITAPLTVYSMMEGMQDYIRFHCYGQDITFNARALDLEGR